MKGSTEKILILLDLYQRASEKEISDKVQKRSTEFRLGYLRKNLLRAITDSKKIADEEIEELKRLIR